MERPAAVQKTVSAFVNWEEVFSTNHRGRREIRFYLKRRDGTSDLAVVAKEKKSGYKTKASSSPSYRYRYAIRDKSLFPVSDIPFETSPKLRSRRQVIDWLTSLVTDVPFSKPPKSVEFHGAKDPLKLKLQNFQDFHTHKTSHHTTEFPWIGSFSICKKKRKHYEAYIRSGIKITVHDFVYVLAEEHKRLVAYMEDLYEDSKGNKMAVVRWFHKVDEVNLDLPHSSYNDKEIFFSLCIQDLSIECIDGPATVLSPQHYQTFLKVNPPHSKFDPFVCQNMFEDEIIKPFDLTQVKGYWNQTVHKLMPLTRNLESHDADVAGIRPKKRIRLGDPNLYTIGSEIEVLSQDSGIRGVWFKGVIIKKHKDKIKVRYHDIKDALDESLNLEEWILASRVAVLDELGIRFNGRTTIRPSRLLKKIDDLVDFDVGCVVDAWWNDGWWEGIVVDKECDEKDRRIHVYFPCEKKRLVFGCKDLRYSQEWVGGEWKQFKNKKDLVASIFCPTQNTKFQDNVSSHDKEQSSVEDLEVIGHHETKEYIVAHLNWNWSTKKKRHGRNSSWRLGHENCKFMFGSSVVPPLTNLVMSR